MFEKGPNDNSVPIRAFGIIGKCRSQTNAFANPPISKTKFATG